MDSSETGLGMTKVSMQPSIRLKLSCQLELKLVDIVHSVIKHPGPDSSLKRRDSNDEHWKDQLKDQKGPSYQSINQAMRCLYM